MLQAHSLLWHYLWIAPHVLQVGMAILMWRRGLQKLFPIFFAYTLIEAAEEFTLYSLDVIPSVPPEAFWRAFCVGLVVEGLLKFALTGELFRHLVRPWPMVAQTGNRLITSAGVILVLVAGLTAGLTDPANPHSLISGGHVLQQSMYVVESGLVLFILAFASYFKLSWNRQTFGIVLGLGILSCEHLAAWATASSGVLGHKAYLLDFANMTTYHVSVLIWMYYLLVPGKAVVKPKAAPPDNNLAVWNQELERLLQR